MLEKDKATFFYFYDQVWHDYIDTQSVNSNELT